MKYSQVEKLLSDHELSKTHDELYHRKPNPNAMTPEETLEKLEQALNDPNLRKGLSEEQIRKAYEFAKQVVEKRKAKTPV